MTFITQSDPELIAFATRAFDPANPGLCPLDLGFNASGDARPMAETDPVITPGGIVQHDFNSGLTYDPTADTALMGGEESVGYLVTRSGAQSIFCRSDFGGPPPYGTDNYPQWGTFQATGGTPPTLAGGSGGGSLLTVGDMSLDGVTTVHGLSFTWTLDGNEPSGYWFAGMTGLPGWPICLNDVDGTLRSVVAKILGQIGGDSYVPSATNYASSVLTYQRLSLAFPVWPRGGFSTPTFDFIISTHYGPNADTITGSTYCERTLWARGLGLMRWEEWNANGAPVVAGRAPPIAGLADPTFPNAVMTDCRHYGVFSDASALFSASLAGTAYAQPPPTLVPLGGFTMPTN